MVGSTALVPENKLPNACVSSGFLRAAPMQRFYISGWNQWEVVEAAAGALQLFGASLPGGACGWGRDCCFEQL